MKELTLALATLLSAAVIAQRPLAPDFTLKGLDGSSSSLARLRGKAVVLNFWATWCPPCRTEIPALMKLRASYGADRLAVIGVAMDEEGAAVVAPFAQRERFALNGATAPLNYTVLIGTDAVGNAYRVDGLPMTVIVDRNGREVRRFESAITFEDVERSVRPLLSGGAFNQ